MAGGVEITSSDSQPLTRLSSTGSAGDSPRRHESRSIPKTGMTDEADVADDVGASIRVPRQEAPRPSAQIASVAAMPSVRRGLARRVRCA
jgi:hypothetical protein